jgi:hypothetical protein
MNKVEALALIGTQESENWQEDLELKVFEIKQFILKSYHTPQVCWARSKKLLKMAEAETFLLGIDDQEIALNEDVSLLFEIKSLVISDILNAYRLFESRLSQIKLSLLKSTTVHSAAIALKNLGDLEHHKLNSLAQLAQQFNITDTPFKLSTFVNSGEIIRELLIHEQKDISESLIQQLPNFSTELVKSLNYINFTKK